VLLDILSAEPEGAGALFEALLTRTPPARLLAFLDERPRPADLLSVAAGMPKAPVARASARMLLRAVGARPVTVG
jgi:hypothetical protein